MKKRTRKPDYYDRFRCIAGACNDSCCIGWEIDVDEERRDAYRKVEGELGERLRTCIDWEEGHFILQGKEERCPFLNCDNLCDLIIGLGEEALCDICREHPRFYEWYDGLTEVGVGLCCEAAARLVLEQEEAAAFVICEEAEEFDPVDEGNGADDDDDTLDVLFSARETAYLILQNRRESIWNRLSQFLSYIDELQEALDFGNLDEVEESAEYYRNISCENFAGTEHDIKNDAENGTLKECKEESEPFEAEAIYSEKERIAAYAELLAYCKELEPIDESWPRRLEALERLFSDPKQFSRMEREMLEQFRTREYEYEHLAVYFVYRYFMKCRTDGDLYSRGCLAVFCILLIRLLDILKFSKTHSLTKEDRAQNAKECSKEIEYSEENLEILSELFWEHGFERISACL